MPHGQFVEPYSSAAAGLSGEKTIFHGSALQSCNENEHTEDSHKRERLSASPFSKHHDGSTTSTMVALSHASHQVAGIPILAQSPHDLAAIGREYPMEHSSLVTMSISLRL
jgi:hypothetical protein